MATENKDDLLDLIFSAPINLPEVKGPPAKPEVPEIHVVEHKDSDAHDKEDAHSNDGSIAHSDTSEKRRDSDAHKHEEHEKEDEHDHIHVKISEPEYTEIVKERRGTEDEQHYVMEESYVSDNESRDEKVHYQEVEEHHDDASDRGRADSDAKEEEEHMQQRAMPAAAPMQMHAVIDDDDHKEHYIEEDVPIHHTESVSSKRSKSSSSSSSSSSDDEHEKHDEPIETAENYFAYDQEQMRRATLESDRGTPSFKVDANSIARSEREESVHEETEYHTAKSDTSSTVSEDHMHYAGSVTPDLVHEDYDNSNVLMCKREEYPEGNTDHRSRASSRSSYRAISVRRESSGSMQHGTFEPERANSIKGEVTEAPGVTNLKALFEQGEPKKARLPRRDSHPPVIDFMNEDSYRRADKPKEQPREHHHHEVKPAEVVKVAPVPAPTAETYLPPRAPAMTPTDKFHSVRVCKNVRQFVKLWGANPIAPGDAHPLSPVNNMEIIAPPQEKKHVLKADNKPGKLTKTMSQPAEPEKKVHAAPPKHEEFQVPDVVFSENYVVDDVKINDLPVSERMKLFEQRKAASRRSTQSKVEEPAPKVVEKSEPVVEAVHERPQAYSRDEIEQEDEENAMTRLTPIAERRRLFEQNAAH